MDWKRVYISLKRRKSNVLLFIILFCTLLLFIIFSAIYRLLKKIYQKLRRRMEVPLK